MKPCPDEWLETYPVAKDVGNVRNNSSDLIDRIGDPFFWAPYSIGDVRYTPLHNLTGHPAISLPVYPSADDSPIGGMFAAARGAEEALLSFALELELELAAARKDRWPQVSAAKEVRR